MYYTTLRLYGGRTEARWYKTAGILLGDQLSNTTPPIGYNRHEYLICMYKKEEADFLTQERGSVKKILSDATLYNKLKN